MSGWRPLSAWVRDAWSRASEVASRPDVSLARAELAVRTWGEELALRQAALVNVAALALAAARRVTVHQVRPAAAALAHATDLHSLPAEPPRLLRSAWVVEARRPETGEALWADTVGLGGYPDGEGGIWLVGLLWPDGIRVARWRPKWVGGELEAGTAQERSPLVGDHEAQEEWVREAARFALVLGLLLDAAAAPLRIDDERELPPRRGGGRRAGDAPEWTTRHVYLDDRARQARAAGAGAAPSEVVGGRIVEAVPVRGHLKRQRHGPGNAEVRWIYVEGYEARRWLSPRPARVVVH